MNKRKSSFIVFAVIALISLMTYKIISNHNTYKVINNQSSSESSGEMQSVITAINNATPNRVEEISNSKDVAYIVINCKYINDSDLEKIINEAQKLNIKLTFINIENISIEKGKLIANGNTILPKNINLEKELKDNGIESYNLSKGVAISKLNDKGIVIYIDNILNLGKENKKIELEVSKLEKQGYSFQALA